MAGAAIASAIVGPLGMAVGASTKSVGVTDNIVTSISLKIYLSDLINPVVDVPFFHSLIGEDANDIAVKAAAKEVNAWYGRFRAILADQGRASTAA